MEDLCRLCLNKDNLNCIFTNIEQAERYTGILALTTGLTIEPNDGFPQKICTNCINLVNSSLQLRDQSHSSEIQLIKMGYNRNINENINFDTQVNENQNYFNENSNDHCDFDGFKIEVEVDRISDSQDGGGEEKATVPSVQPKLTKKEKRKLYLDMVEGVYDPNKPVKCKVCKTTVSKWACFINHAKKHLGFKFVCEYCGKSFISSNQMKRHCRSYHGMERDIKCKHCDYLALDNAQLVVHERRMHTGVRPFVCDVCAASYFNRKCLIQHIESHRTTASVQVHERRMHTGVRPFVCDVCAASYFNRKCLIQHLESHRTTATVQCDKCSLLFKSRRHLSQHKYGVHGEKRKARRRLHRAEMKARIQENSTAGTST